MLFWTCLHHATDSAWSVLVRRQLENLASLLPYFALLFIPLLLVARYLWHWWDMAPGVDPLLDNKQPYLSVWFFLVRAVLLLRTAKFARLDPEENARSRRTAMVPPVIRWSCASTVSEVFPVLPSA
jgi:hypothetical protein